MQTILRLNEIKEKKAAAYEALHTLFEDLEEPDWNRPVYGHSDGWTVREALTHLVTAGTGLLRAAQLIAEGRLEMRSDFDMDFWNRRQVEKRAGRSVPLLLVDLKQLHQDTLAYLDALADQDDETVLTRTGQHAIFGEVTVEYVLRRIYRHEREHTVELRNAFQEG